jgi:hypothetical protein
MRWPEQSSGHFAESMIRKSAQQFSGKIMLEQ